MNAAQATRRQALTAIALSAAVAVAPVSAIAATTGARDRSAWDRAVARMRSVEADYDRALESARKADRAFADACPARDDLRRFNLSPKHPRKVQIGNAEMQLTIEAAQTKRFAGRMTKEEADILYAEAERIVDEFAAFDAQRKQAAKDCRIDEWEKVYDDACDRRYEAREAVLRMEAPDQQALLLKIELLAAELEGSCEGDAENLSAVAADARRLLASGRA